VPFGHDFRGAGILAVKLCDGIYIIL